MTFFSHLNTALDLLSNMFLWPSCDKLHLPFMTGGSSVFECVCLCVHVHTCVQKCVCVCVCVCVRVHV